MPNNLPDTDHIDSNNDVNVIISDEKTCQSEQSENLVKPTPPQGKKNIFH
ncbi:MAG: hypothetical protein HQK75_10395 [Candidatus Magnetomorum sp.]|nr:hypothetical protein [Candidatus Magnetomorum sp.]